MNINNIDMIISEVNKRRGCCSAVVEQIGRVCEYNCDHMQNDDFYKIYRLNNLNELQLYDDIVSILYAFKQYIKDTTE